MMFSQWLNSHRICKRLAKALIRLPVCAGWSEPLLAAHTTLLEISRPGSYRESIMDACLLLTSFKVLGKYIQCEALLSILNGLMQ